MEFIFKKRIRKFTTTQIIILGYLTLILLGTFLLSLPFASKTPGWTNFVDSLFTATSATCVTGLITVPTFEHWTLFGQLVILVLIQIGGIGFVSILTIFSLFLNRKIGLYERKLIMQSAGSFEIANVVSLVIRVIIITLSVELLGVILLSIRFIPDFGIVKGIYRAIFTSTSAYCNAGFDLFEGGTSLMPYANDVLVNVVIMCLIIIGGLGFLVWNDIIANKLKWSKYHLHTKIVILMTLGLIILPAIFFFFFEKNKSMQGMEAGERILASLFQSVSSRTAGFATVDYSTMSHPSNILSMVLFIIGGSPGGTAGGIKTTTFFVLLLSVLKANKKATHIRVNNRRLEANIVRQATSISLLYIELIVVGAIIILAIQGDMFTVEEVLFETCSATGTVGTTLGITQELYAGSKIVIILLMFIGRIGGFTLLLLFQERDTEQERALKQPKEKLILG